MSYLNEGAYASGIFGPAALNSGGLAPNQISNLALWLDASQLSGLSDGDPVSSWTDQSGNNYHAAQATLGKQPEFKTNLVNGKPALRFDGVDDRLSFSGSALGMATDVSGFSVVMVMHTNTLGSSARPFYLAQGFDNYTRINIGVEADQRMTLLARRVDYGSSQEVASATNIWPTSGFHLYTTNVDFANTSANLWLNGANVGTTTSLLTAGNTSGTNSASGYIGATISGGYLAGDLAEMIAYPRAITTDEREQLELYLANKYGITLL